MHWKGRQDIIKCELYMYTILNCNFLKKYTTNNLFMCLPSLLKKKDFHVLVFQNNSRNQRESRIIIYSHVRTYMLKLIRQHVLF